MRAWFQEATGASWRTPAELKSQYPTANTLKGGRAVFSGCEERFCLVVLINYHAHIIVVRWVGTRDEYDGISAEQV